MHFPKSLRPHLLATAAALLCAQAAAQTTSAKKTELEAVTITAEKRMTSVQKSALSVVAIGGEEIAEQGLASGADILKNVANVEVQGAARGNVIAIRGMGSDLPPGMGESVVSTNYDGVYSFRAEASSLGFFDLDRVEILRGPQGTLYGRNAAAGAVNYITRDPVLGKQFGNGSLELGDYSLMRGELGFNVPVTETIAVRASVATIARNGYLSDGYNDAKSGGGRIKVLYQPSKDVRLLLGAERIDLSGKGAGFIPQDNWNDAGTRLQAAVGTGTNAGLEKVGSQDYTATKLWAQADVNLGFATLTVIPASQSARGVVARKYDASRPPGSEESYSADPDPARQKSVEMRLASNTAGRGLQWVAGAYYYDMLNKQQCIALCDNAGPATRDTTTSKAVFGQVTMPLGTVARLTGGVRHTRDNKTNISGGSDDWKSIDGKLTAEYDLSATALAYLTYATAYRPGGYNSFTSPPTRFEKEKLRSLELGLKSRWLEGALQFNGAMFNYDYRGYQAIDFRLVGNTAFAAFINVPKQTISGAEAEVQTLLPADLGRARASLTWLDAKFGELSINGVDMRGKVLPHAPKFSAKVGYDYAIGLGGAGDLMLSTDVRYTAKQYVSINESDATLQPGMTKVDLSANYRVASDRWGANLYVKNATNYVAKTANFAGYTLVGAPRTFGVVLTSKF